jgi:hypothetical protein
MAFPGTPKIEDTEHKEIASYQIKDLGNGIIVFNGAAQVKDYVLKHIDERAAEAHKGRWSYVIDDEDGVKYGVNEDGFRYREHDIPGVPVRLLAPVNAETPQDIAKYFYELEDTIYKCLLRYIDIFPLVIGSLWWKTRGHILRYDDEGKLGWHQDNDTNYKVTGGVRYMPKGQVALRQTMGALVYFNNSVDKSELDGTNFAGGHLLFYHLGIDYAPQAGDIIFFPTNYVCAHSVSRMEGGTRYAYLTFFGQGGSEEKVGIVISDADKSDEWCPPVWFENIFDDYESYCRSEYSLWANPVGMDQGVNPVFQNRCVTQYGNTHTTEQ